MGDCLKREAWRVCRLKEEGGLGKKEGGGVFEGGVDTLMHTLGTLVKKKNTTINTRTMET